MKFGQLMDIIMGIIFSKSLPDLKVWVLHPSISQPIKDKKTVMASLFILWKVCTKAIKNSSLHPLEISRLHCTAILWKS